MKLKYKEDHISIKYFDEIDLEDFTVFTGKNGSGKTHLLEAIDLGKAEVEGVDKSEIVYYNYNDFSVFEGKTQNDPLRNQRRYNWNNERNQLIQRINEAKQRAYQKAVRDSGNDAVENYIYDQAQKPNFDFENQFGKAEDYAVLEEFKADDILNINRYSSRFSPSFYQLINQFVVNKKEILTLDKKLLEDYFTNARERIIENFETENKELFQYIDESTTGDKIFSLNPNDIENPDFFLEDIANEEKEYQFKKTKNSLDKLEAEEWGSEIEYLDKDAFLDKYGSSPVEQINEVLKEYDCNGYFLTTNRFQAQLGQDKKNMNVNIQLKHREKNYQTTFKQLSSGEKTLIALSLLIYKTRKNKVIPRMLLLDEVDSSLHPSMIKRLLSVIQEHFVRKLKMKVILATHSPTTVALAPPDSVFTVERSGNKKIIKEDIQKAIDILTEGFATLNVDESNLGIEYNISNTDLPILFTEGITDKIIIETAWEKLYDTSMPFFVQDCFDASFLANLFRRGYDTNDGIFVNHHDRILIALFDFDEEGYNSWNSIVKLDENFEPDPRKGLAKCNQEKNAFKLLLPVPGNDIEKQVIKSGNHTFKNDSLLPIELLFYGLPELSSFYRKELVTGGSEVVEFRGKKRKFANKLKDLDKSKFNSIVPLLDQIKRIINTSTQPDV
ncbi:AAA family ATPase [Aquimarina brevivitae]|uniref:Putative AbiEii toxin of type IV toxin-antitoxin system n=1 Tax=Aquimarina brevivitae TaxID=323412 RepID=A0A4Q7PJG4_9FLAO|nr:AAA family ATPase [Aquimarina brevivitae]RZT00189.1 putative AbiEii toxin of type IV toxin-antitoxin system [Aquimarina brevivitae]